MYLIGTISNIKRLVGLNRFYMTITSPSVHAVVNSTSQLADPRGESLTCQ